MAVRLPLSTDEGILMTDRCALFDQRWQMIEDSVSPPQLMGRPRRNGRQMLDEIF